MKKYTREELVKMVDSAYSTEELVELKELSRSNPEVKKMLADIKSEYKSEGSIFDLVTRGVNLSLEVGAGDEEGLFEVIDKYLDMPPSVCKNDEDKTTISLLVNDFISTSKLPKEKLELLSEKMNKLLK